MGSREYEPQQGNLVEQQIVQGATGGDTRPAENMSREYQLEQKRDIHTIAETQADMARRQANMEQTQVQELREIAELRKEISEMKEE